MLAYELYKCTQKPEADQTGQFIEKVEGDGIPIKKIFVDNGEIKSDNKTIQDYGYEDTYVESINNLQRELNMPLDTHKLTGLPNKLVRGATAPDYLKIDGYFKYVKEKFIIELTTKKQQSCIELHITDDKSEERKTNNTEFNISTNCYINDKLLYELYKEHRIIQDQNIKNNTEIKSTRTVTFDYALFKKISLYFHNYIKDSNYKFTNKKSQKFALYILPTDAEIDYKPTHTYKYLNASKMDSFGNKTDRFSTKSTNGAFFLSFNNSNVSLNFKTENEFYENINVGADSMEQIIIPAAKKISIMKLDWYFINITDPDRFYGVSYSSGIYSRLFWCYKKLKEISNLESLSTYNVICLKNTKSESTVLINENLTMKQMEIIFKNDLNQQNVVSSAFEILILDNTSNDIYRYYIMAVKSLLNQTYFDRDLLFRIFNAKIHSMLKEWLTTKKNNKTALVSTKNFFMRTEFCIKRLKYPIYGGVVMKEIETSAVKVGQLLHICIDYAQNTNNNTNTYKPLLYKPKYDTTTLREIYAQVCRKSRFMTLEPDKEKILHSKISELTQQINDEMSNDIGKDFSYFFYKGYFGGDE